jgi:hypothetical protein
VRRGRLDQVNGVVLMSDEESDRADSAPKPLVNVDLRNLDLGGVEKLKGVFNNIVKAVTAGMGRMSEHDGAFSFDMLA